MSTLSFALSLPRLPRQSHQSVRIRVTPVSPVALAWTRRETSLDCFLSAESSKQNTAILRTLPNGKLEPSSALLLAFRLKVGIAKDRPFRCPGRGSAEC